MCKILFYINNFKFKIRELSLEQFVLITCCKTMINAIQIKVETTIYYFNNKYNGGEESKKINAKVERMKARENARE